MTDLKFVAPPASRSSKVGDWITALREDGSGNWAEFDGGGNPTQAEAINKGKGYGVAFAGEFEATARTIDGKGKLYARFIPDAVAPKPPTKAEQAAIDAAKEQAKADRIAKAKETRERNKAAKAALEAQAAEAAGSEAPADGEPSEAPAESTEAPAEGEGLV